MHRLFFLCCCIRRIQGTYDRNLLSKSILSSSCQSAATKHLMKSGAHMLWYLWLSLPLDGFCCKADKPRHGHNCNAVQQLHALVGVELIHMVTAGNEPASVLVTVLGGSVV